MIDIWSALGTKPSGERLARIVQSPQYRDGRFVNTLPTISSGMSFSAARDFFLGGSDYREPTQPLPVVERSAAEFAGPASDFRVTWLGHSTLLVELDGARLLVDPVWGERASPMSFAGPERFYAPPLALDDLPPLDAVVISHDHYDHLDEPTIRARSPTACPASSSRSASGLTSSTGASLRPGSRSSIGGTGRRSAGVTLVSTPARHFSGRFLTDRDATLWSGWAFLGAERTHLLQRRYGARPGVRRDRRAARAVRPHARSSRAPTTPRGPTYTWDRSRPSPCIRWCGAS